MTQSTDSTVMELRVAECDVDAFAEVFDRLRTAGITFSMLRELQTENPKWLTDFMALDNATRAETRHPEVPRSEQQMLERLAKLRLDPDACFVARAGEQWVGYTVLDTANSTGGRLRQSWTGVHPDYRRLGIGTALKVITIRYARAHRYEVIVTSMRGGNEASERMSRSVGFRVSG